MIDRLMVGQRIPEPVASDALERRAAVQHGLVDRDKPLRVAIPDRHACLTHRIRDLRPKHTLGICPSLPHDPIGEPIRLCTCDARGELLQGLFEAHASQERIMEALAQALARTLPPVTPSRRRIHRPRRRWKQTKDDPRPQLALRRHVLHRLGITRLIEDILDGAGFPCPEPQHGGVQHRRQTLIAQMDGRIKLVFHQSFHLSAASTQEDKLRRIVRTDQGEDILLQKRQGLKDILTETGLDTQGLDLSSDESIRNLLVNRISQSNN